ncbi:MAG: patatin-like phospholipase family protein [Bacteroidetes bacterium]|nr:patatin-like phospholipase family protein [Fibrella sp.]
MRGIPQNGWRCLRYLFVLSLSFSVSTALPADSDSLRYKNIVFEGGGVRGIAYAGALTVLENRGKLRAVERVGGTSVGAITALLLALGYTTAEMKAILTDLNIQQFNDGRGFFIGGFHRMARRYGWYRGERLEKWIDMLIVRKTGNAALTFADLHQRHRQQPAFKDLYVTGTNLTTQKGVVFSHEHTPTMTLKTTVRISLSVPMYFGAVFMDADNRIVPKPKKGQAYQVLVDGGLTANYPLDLFDTNEQPNPETLGLKLERPEQLQHRAVTDGVAPYPIRNVGEYVGAFYNYIIENLNDKRPALEKERTVYISTAGITPRVRRMRTDQTRQLYESGERAATAFLK